MSEVGEKLKVSEVFEQQVDANDYKEIKPEGDITLKESRDFWDNIFKSEISEETDKQYGDEDVPNEGNDIVVNEGLTDADRAKIKEETGWSDEIIDAIESMEEYEIYKNAGLQEAEIGEKKCLIRSDIDWDQKDLFGKTNRERAAEGHAPLDKNGKPIQLHHIGQHADSPLAELTFEEHRCGGNDSILHDKTIETEVHGEGSTWDSERGNYWKSRSENERSSNNE